MTKEQKELFEKLTKKRQKTAEALNDPSVSGFKKSVVDKYSDQAHFIYELLQNADDVGATSVSFELREDRLIYRHNGTRHFTVSDVADERDQSKLGDLNAITSIGNSSKTTIQKIGKFGVGFKAVFQYTDNPIIYEPVYKFRIDELIVPIPIDADFPGREEEETVFEFPFNLSNKSKEDCFEEIAYKLRNLDYPILFLRNLRNIYFTDKNGTGFYSREIDEEIKFGNTIAQRIQISNYDNGTEKKEKLWLFSRINEQGLNYCVGFFLDTKETKKKNKKTGEESVTISEVLRSVEIPAFCYFSTQMKTNLGFIIHAPFLLNDSREGIKAGEKHNHQQINNLSKLAADCFVYLKQINKDFLNEDIFELIPYRQNDLYGDNKNKLSFSPFYENILDIFSREELLPTDDGFVKAEKAFIAYSKNIPKIFSNEKLAELYEIEGAKWVFPFVSPESLKNDNTALFNYLCNLTRRAYLYENEIKQYREEFGEPYDYDKDDNFVTHKEIFHKVTENFIEAQTIDWLAKFYGYIAEIKPYYDWFRDKPIFWDTEKNAVSAFDGKKHQSLFLPSKKVSGYVTINHELLTKNQTKKLVELYGLREPSFRDEIYQVILPEMNGEIIKYDEKFKKIFSYYLECNRDEAAELVNELKNKTLWLGTNSESELNEAKNLYIKTEVTEKLFSNIKKVNYLDIAYYSKLVLKEDEKYLYEFFESVGVKNGLQFIKQELDSSSVRWNRVYPEYEKYNWPYSTEGYSFIESNIDYLWEILENITKDNNIETALLLWKEIIKEIEKQTNQQSDSDIKYYFSLECRYKYYNYYRKSYEGRGHIWLKEKAWIIDKNNNLKSAKEIYLEELSSKYDVSSKISKAFLSFLEIKQNPNTEFLNKLSEEEKKNYLRLQKIKEAGYSDEEIDEAFALLEAKRNKHDQYDGSNYLGKLKGYENTGYSNSIAQIMFHPDSLGENSSETKKINQDENDSVDKETPVFNEIRQAIKKRKAQNIADNSFEKEQSIISDDFEEYEDVDDYNPKSVDYQRRIDSAKNRTINEIMQYEREQRLQNIANTSEKYSYEWFRALLELEMDNSKDSYSKSREVSICFTKVEKEEGTEHTLILKQPNRSIPQYMEDLTDISLKIFINDDTLNLIIEAINVHSYSIRAKLRANIDLSKIDVSQIQEAYIEAMSPIFLLEELKKSFDKLSFNPKKNLKKDLCSNIEFIFGPPGTGKTTHLVKNVLIPTMNTRNKKILVLTPTNKAADVLVKKVMDFVVEPEWLIRFGVTGDESIEMSSVFKDREFDIKKLEKAIVVTTIARFPYDYFIAGNSHYELKELNWDYIVIDEASMIPLINIIYLLYKKEPEKFIIAGDPFQIEPITAVELWKNENIYTLVELNSFTNPTTKPKNYSIELLSTQYRSIPVIGQIYGHICYGNVLKHDRTKNSRKSFEMKDKTQFGAVNLIYFPVSEYESIFRTKSLNGKSPYQIYLSIFIYEFVKYISNNIQIPEGEKRSLGIIAPYRAQADLIQKLCERSKLNERLDVQVSTIHGFQGDECDIVVAVFNTPEKISGGKGIFLNKKNIINVAVSRARDYLFVVMPEREMKGKQHLLLINQLEALCVDCGAKTFNTKELEQKMFSNSNYIEENTFSTSHQNINVYEIPEKKYEVRTEDSAVDIQIHKKLAVIKVKK